MSIRQLARSLGYWLPLSLLTVTAGVLTWLNRSPWWGWALVVALLSGIGAAARWWTKAHVIVQVGAWLLTGAIVVATAIVAHPAPERRLAGGEDRSPSRPVQTQQGTVVGVYNDERTVEVFAGIPYAQPPVGELRWRAPQPPDTRTRCSPPTDSRPFRCSRPPRSSPVRSRGSWTSRWKARCSTRIR
jgi:para-nitrobenzyl esterase